MNEDDELKISPSTRQAKLLSNELRIATLNALLPLVESLGAKYSNGDTTMIVLHALMVTARGIVDRAAPTASYKLLARKWATQYINDPELSPDTDIIHLKPPT